LNTNSDAKTRRRRPPLSLVLDPSYILPHSLQCAQDVGQVERYITETTRSIAKWLVAYRRARARIVIVECARAVELG